MFLRLVIMLALGLNIAYADELQNITPEAFLAANPSPERKAIVDFIVHQFDGKKVSQAELDKLWRNKKERNKRHLARFQIINQKIYADSYQIDGYFFMILLEYFQKIVKQYHINDIDFIIDTLDVLPMDIDPALATITTFMLSKNLDSTDERNKLLLPDAFIIKDEWQKLATRIEKANPLYPWNVKEEKIFWRGSSTGRTKDDPDNLHSYTINNINKLPRLSLVMLSKLYPNLIDAKIAYYFSINDEGKKLGQILDLLFGNDSKSVIEEDHLKYKYLIAIDGHTCPWIRVPWIMLSNSVLIKQDSNKIEWFYPALKPYIHYIPVHENLDNIFAQLEWMKQHDLEVQQISQNAQNFIRNNLMPEDINAQMAIILNEYSKIQQDSRIVPTLTNAEEVFMLPALFKLLFRKIKAKVIDY